MLTTHVSNNRSQNVHFPKQNLTEPDNKKQSQQNTSFFLFKSRSSFKMQMLFQSHLGYKSKEI